MIELDEFRATMASYRDPLGEVKSSLDIENKTDRIAKLNYEMEQPDFWDDIDRSREVSKELKGLQDLVENYKKLENDYVDIDTLILMAEEENDPSLVPEIGEQIDIFTKEFEEYRINLLFTDEFDDCNAVLSHSIQERAERSPATGRVCCTECIPDGQKSTA